jgi:hypothetical protein
LQLDSRQRKRLPLLGRLLSHLDDFGGLRKQTPFEDEYDSHAVKQMTSSPVELDIDLVSRMRESDVPEWLWNEVSYA